MRVMTRSVICLPVLLETTSISVIVQSRENARSRVSNVGSTSGRYTYSPMTYGCRTEPQNSLPERLDHGAIFDTSAGCWRRERNLETICHQQQSWDLGKKRN